MLQVFPHCLITAAITVTSPGCYNPNTSLAWIVNDSTLGVTTSSGLSKREVTVYPNPVRNELTIDGAEPGTLVTLYNIIGQEVYSGIMSDKKEVIDTKALLNGIYFLQITNKDGIKEVRKVVKQ